LSVVPPTEPAVRALLDAARLAPDAQIAYIRDRAMAVTAEKVAINAVMAGCKPEYMPVVVAAVEGIGDPRWGYHGPGTSTGGAAVLLIVNGPIARELDVNAGDNLFGPGWRANLTIGRALRLVMRNVCGSMPGLLDRGTVGHPGKLSYVIAENEAESPWTPLSVERGFRPEQSTVTVMAAEGPHQFYNQLSSTAEGILTTLADNMRVSGNVMGQPHYALVLAGEHMRTIAADGWDKKRIRQFVWENTQNSHAHLKRTNRMTARSSPATGRRCGRSWPRRTTSSWSPPAGAPARSRASFRAGRARSPPPQLQWKCDAAAPSRGDASLRKEIKR